MNYKIIQDETLFKKFIEQLPELKSGEQYYITLFARKKYDTTGLIKSDKSQLKRFTATKEFIYRKVKQLEVELGAYTDNGNPIPQESLALYISVNPRSLIKATKDSLIEFAKLITEEYTGYNPHAIVMSKIQTSSGTRYFSDFDFDNVTFEDTLKLIDFNKINKEAIKPLITRGGFHLLVELSKIDKSFSKTWYQHIMRLPGGDMRGDNLIPVPGCAQGGFVPYFKDDF
jgi:hypothetical protein